MPFSFIPFLLISGYVATISTSMLNNRYRKRIVLSLISFILGIIFDLFSTDGRRFSHIIFGLLPLLYIFYYEILRIIFKPLIGNFPYLPFREKIGVKVLGLGYPKNRKVKFVDYVFGMFLISLPLITIILLSILLNKHFE